MKEKKDIQRYIKYQFGYKQKATEQEYIDHKFEELERRAEALIAELDLLKTLNQREYVFIHEEIVFYIPNSHDFISESKEAREWAEKNGYRYIKTIKPDGELWVKEK